MRLGADIRHGEVVGLSFDSRLTVETTDAAYTADAVILATGAARQAPKIPGLADFEGAGVSYCAVCDGFFFKGKDVAVLGHGEFAMHEAGELLPVVKSVTFLTHGRTPPPSLPQGTRVIETPIAQFIGDKTLNGVLFTNGQTLAVAGVFVAEGVAGSTALAKKLGAATEGNRIVVNGSMATNVPGLYAAGDCTGGFYQVSKAVYEGAAAGSAAVKHVRAKAGGVNDTKRRPF